ncbi:MAG: efflux RND transporter periplasmic adaptor subunit [bacterium]
MTEEMVDAEAGKTGQSRVGGIRARLAKPVIGLVILVVLILWSVGVFHSGTPPGRVAYDAGVRVLPGAEVFTVKAEPVAPRVDVVGTVASGLKVNISPRIPAVVKEVLVAPGSPVVSGQALVSLDDREISEQVMAAEAQFRQAETELNRTRQLFDVKAATEQALTAAQAMFTSAKAQWERSKVVLTYTRITSPMDGVVTDRHVEPGDLANPGQLLLSIYDPTNMQLHVPVPVRLLGQLPVGQVVEVTLDRAASALQGRVRQIVSEIDPMSRTQLVKVQLDGIGGDVMPGTFGRLWVADEARTAMMIPVSAVYTAGQVELVQVRNGERAVRRAVRTGPVRGSTVEVLSGLAAGDIVLVNPAREN